MTPQELSVRTKKFALSIIDLSSKFPRTTEADIIKRQLLRSGTSVGANYRAACRARSDNEFLSKLSIVIEEADETQYWLEIASEAKILTVEDINELYSEAVELIKIFVSSRQTVRARIQKS